MDWFELVLQKKKMEKTKLYKKKAFSLFTLSERKQIDFVEK